MDPEREAMIQEYKRFIGAEDIEAFKQYMQTNSGELDEEWIKSQVEWAKKFAGDDDLFSLSPAVRVDRVRQLMEDNGLREVENMGYEGPKEIDSHYVSSIMQVVYGIDMGMELSAAIDIVINPFHIHSTRAKLNNPESLKKALEEFEKLPQEVKEQMKNTARAIAEGDDEELEETKRIGDAMFEAMARNTHSSGLPEELSDVFGAISSVYKEKFGEAQLGRYECPVDRTTVEFCKNIFRAETGKNAPKKLKILVDPSSRRPYSTDRGEIVIPTHIESELELVQCLMLELPHATFRHGGVDFLEFAKDRKEFFRELAWDEGIPERITEKALTELIRANNPGRDSEMGEVRRQFKESLMKGCIGNLSFEQFMHPEYLMKVGSENVALMGTYTSLAYPVGYHIVGSMPKETFRKLMNQDEPWKSPEFPLSRPLKGELRSDIRKLWEEQRNFAAKKIGGQVKQYYDVWASDFLS